MLHLDKKPATRIQRNREFIVILVMAQLLHYTRRPNGEPHSPRAPQGHSALLVRWLCPPTHGHLRAPSENRNEVLNAIPCILSNTLRDPCDISDLLLLQPEVSIEHRVLELLQEGEFIEVHLSLKEPVLQLGCNRRRVLRAVAVDACCRCIKEATILDDIIAHLPHLFDLVRLGEEVVARGEQAANRWV